MAANSELIKLGAEQEYRFETGKEGVTVQVVSGSAESFGAEAAEKAEYVFGPDTKASMYTWEGARLQVTGAVAEGYVAGSTPMPMYANVHDSLQSLRNTAKASGGKVGGPVVVVAGPQDVGKSSLCKILVNYAVREGGTPVYVDLDVGQGGVTVPGMLSAAILERPFDIATGVPEGSVPLVYFFGHTSPGENIPLYDRMLEKVADQVSTTFAGSPDIGATGAIINTCGWIDGKGLDILKHSIRVFDADIVLVLDNDRLAQVLTSHFSLDPTTTVVQLPKSGGVVTRSSPFRRAARAAKISEYFYGPYGDLCPAATPIYFRDVHIFRIGIGEAAPLSALPLGAEPEPEPIVLTKVLPTAELNSCLLAVSFAQSEDEILDANIGGFLHVTDVQVDKAKMMVLAPSHGELPGPFLLLGDIEWIQEG